MKKLGIKIIILAVLALFIWKWAPQIQWDQLKIAFEKANWILWGLASLSILIAWLLRSFIFYRILQLKSSFKFSYVFATNMLGALMDQIIPGRSGVLVRWGMLSLKSPKTKAFNMSAAMACLGLDALALVLLFLGAGCFSPMIRDFSNPKIFIVLLVAVSLLFISLLRSHQIDRLVSRTFLGRISLVKAVFEIIHQMREPSKMVLWLGLALANWFLQVLCLHLAAMSFGLEFDFSQYVLLLMAINLAIVVPVVPGNIGTIQVVMTGVLSHWGVAATQALAYSMAYHLAHLAVIFLVGGGLSLIYPIHFSQLRESKEKELRAVSQ